MTQPPKQVQLPPEADHLVRRTLSTPTGLLVLWLVVSVSLLLVDPYGVPLAVRAYLLTGLLFTLGLLVATLAARPLTLRQGLTAVKLGPWIGVGFSVVFGLATLTWRSPATGTAAVVDTNYLFAAGMIASIGLLALLCGYRLVPAGLSMAADRIDRGLRGRAPAQPSAIAAIVLWLIAMAAIAAQIQNGSFGYLTDEPLATRETSSLSAVLAALTELGTVATFLAAWRHARIATAGAGLMLLFVAGSQIGLGLFAGFKEDAIIQLVAIFIGWGIWRRPRVVALLLAGLFVVLFVFPFIAQYREQVSRGGSGRLSPAAALASIDFGQLVDSALSTSSSESAQTASDRLTRIGDLAVIIQKTPEQVPYLPARELAAGPVLGFVPRSVWNEKPVLDAGYQMSTVYYGLPRTVRNSSALTPYGDLWRHGGLPVVVVGMLALGTFVRAVDDRSGDPRVDPRILFLPLLLFAPLVKQERDFLGFTASLASILLAAVLAARVVTATSARSEDSIGVASSRPKLG